jgi:hypothetical protein
MENFQRNPLSSILLFVSAPLGAVLAALGSDQLLDQRHLWGRVIVQINTFLFKGAPTEDHAAGIVIFTVMGLIWLAYEFVLAPQERSKKSFFVEPTAFLRQRALERQARVFEGHYKMAKFIVSKLRVCPDEHRSNGRVHLDQKIEAMTAIDPQSPFIEELRHEAGGLGLSAANDTLISREIKANREASSASVVSGPVNYGRLILIAVVGVIGIVVLVVVFGGWFGYYLRSH